MSEVHESDLVAKAFAVFRSHPESADDLLALPVDAIERLAEALRTPRATPAAEAGAQLALSRLPRRSAPPPRLLEYLEAAGPCLIGAVGKAFNRFRVRSTEALREADAFFAQLADRAVRTQLRPHYGAAGVQEVAAEIYPRGAEQATFATHCQVERVSYRGEGVFHAVVRVQAGDLARAPRLEHGYVVVQVIADGATRSSHLVPPVGALRRGDELELTLVFEVPPHTQGNGIEDLGLDLPCEILKLVLFEGE